MMTYVILFAEFFKIGLFAIGGGLATLPFLYELVGKYPWFTKEMLGNMIAVSQSTPGPIGINIATYAGFNAKGILGAIVATTALVLPAFVIIIVIAHFLSKFRESKLVNSVFYGLRPAVTALIAAAGFEIVKISIITWDKFINNKHIANLIDIKSLVLFVVIFYLIKKYNKHPLLYITIGAVFGIIFKL